MSQITISQFSYTLAQAPFTDGDVTLRVWFTGGPGAQFIDADGNIVPYGNAGSFFKEVACTVASNIITVPAFTLPATDNSSNISTIANAQFYVNDAPAEFLFTSWIITSTLGATVTYNSLYTFNLAASIPYTLDSTYLTAPQVAALIAAAVTTQAYASTTIAGITRLSTAPASPTIPISAGSNDTRIPAVGEPIYWASQYTSFNAAVTAIGSTRATLVVSGSMTSVTTATVPATLTLQFTGGGKLTLTTGQTLTIVGPILAPIGQQIFSNATSGQGTITFTANTSIDRYYIDWWGTPAGTADSLICQAAASAFPIGAYVKLVPSRTYATKVLSVKQSQTWELVGATLVALLGVSNNELFDIGATTAIDLNGTVWTTNTALSSATAGATSITVTSSTGFTVGDRVVISAGSFTGSGTEFGPIEFNTISSIPDATHIVVKAPLAYNYSGFGLAGAANKKVYKVPSTQPRDVKIFGGTIQPDAAFNSIYFNINGAENVEIYGITFNGLAGGLTTGGYTSGLNFHDCHLKGTGLVSGGTNFNFASLVYSRITNNLLNANGTTLLNGTNFEVTCHDNIVEGNIIGPLRATSVAAIEFNKYAFNNIIRGNRIWGLDTDIAAGVATLGIRTYAVGTPSGTGNIISDNLLTDVMLGIGDTGDNSVISGNSHYNATLHANATGIITDTNKATIGVNQYRNLTRATLDSAQTAIPAANTYFPSIIALREGTALTVGSNTITPTSAIHQVGAGLIKTITVPSGFTSGTIALVPTAAFTYDATGNVLGTGTATIGRTMYATYSSSTSKWSMSY